MCKYPELDDEGLQQVKSYIDIGLQCADIDQRQRPSIEKVLLMLKAQDLP